MSTQAVIYLRVSRVGQVNTAHDPEGYCIRPTPLLRHTATDMPGGLVGAIRP